MANRPKRNQRARTITLAGREVESVGLQNDFWSDFSHRSLTASLPLFIAGATVAFLALNCLFAWLFWLGDRPVANAPGDFLHYFFFSIETLATVGYGDMHPQTHYGHVVASIEMFVGIFFAAIVTGLIFYRFSRPRARILFAERAVVTIHDGVPCLMIRAANERLNNISGPTVKLWLSTTVTTAEGKPFRRFNEMRPLRAQSPLFVLSWSIIHVIDETSPMFGLDAEDLEAAQGSILIMIEGYDETAAQTVRARKTYMSSQVIFGHRYVDVLDDAGDDRVRLNYTRFHHTEPEA